MKLAFQGLTGKISFKEGNRANMRMDLLKLRNYRLERVGEWYHSESLLNITNQEAFNQYKMKNVSLRVTVVLVCFVFLLFPYVNQFYVYLKDGSIYSTNS